MFLTTYITEATARGCSIHRGRPEPFTKLADVGHALCNIRPLTVNTPGLCLNQQPGSYSRVLIASASVAMDLACPVRHQCIKSCPFHFVSLGLLGRSSYVKTAAPCLHTVMEKLIGKRLAAITPTLSLRYCNSVTFPSRGFREGETQRGVRYHKVTFPVSALFLTLEG